MRLHQLDLWGEITLPVQAAVKMLNRQFDVQGETLKSAARYTGWIIGSCGAPNANGRKHARDLGNQIRKKNMNSFVFEEISLQNPRNGFKPLRNKVNM